VAEAVTIDLDATGIEVYGRKRGAARSRHGQMSYAPHVAFWAQRGRALTAELVAGNREKLSGRECARIAKRAIRLLPQDHGPVTFRIDSAYYQLELLQALRAEQARFTVSVPRSEAMWKTPAQIPESAWREAIDMEGAQAAETTYKPSGWRNEPLRLIIRRVPFSAEQIARLKGSRRLRTIHPQQLELALEGKIASVYEHANRVWLTAALTALNLNAFCCDLCPAAGASGKAPQNAPLRRAAKTLRNLLFCIPARIVRTGRRLILRPAAGYPHRDILTATLHAIYALGP
jgi:hypothetical protein